MRILFCLSLIFTFIMPAYASSKIKVVASFSILADVIKNIGQNRVNVISIVGPNEDAHIYEPTPDDNKLILESDIVFINGLGFESWFKKLIRSSGYQGYMIDVSKGIDPIIMYEPLLDKTPVPDPHVWGSVSNVIIWVKNIRKSLCTIDPKHKDYYIKNETNYLIKLQELNQYIVSKVTQVNKIIRVVTSHDAFNYYAKEYNVQFLTPQGISTDTSPSALEMANIVKQIRKHNIKKIFIENIANNQLITQIQDETKVTIGGTLYSDALSYPDGIAGDYIRLMKHNTNNILSSYTE